jgi:hypothetical protein
MSYRQNSPFGLRPIGHLQGGASDITLARGLYTVDQVNAVTLNYDSNIYCGYYRCITFQKR